MGSLSWRPSCSPGLGVFRTPAWPGSWVSVAQPAPPGHQHVGVCPRAPWPGTPEPSEGSCRTQASGPRPLSPAPVPFPVGTLQAAAWPWTALDLPRAPRPMSLSQTRGLGSPASCWLSASPAWPPSRPRQSVDESQPHCPSPALPSRERCGGGHWPLGVRGGQQF